MIEHGITGRLIPSGSIEDLVREIADLADHADIARSLGAAARARVSQDFSESRMSQSTFGIYTDQHADRGSK